MMKPSEVHQSVDVLHRGATKQELLVKEAFFMTNRKPSLNSQQEGRDSVKSIFICSLDKYLKYFILLLHIVIFLPLS